jgi:AbrB family looped-hinge helix DNA binding protein
MKNASTISSKGQITVPQEIRTRLGLATGDRVEFVVEGDKTVMRPARQASGTFEKYRGALGTFPGGAKEINAWVRDLRDPDRDDATRRPEQNRRSKKAGDQKAGKTKNANGH